MVDYEKVKKAISICIDVSRSCTECPYCESSGCNEGIVADFKIFLKDYEKLMSEREKFDPSKFAGDIIVERRKKINGVILAQIREIISDKGLTSEIELSDNDIVEAIRLYLENKQTLASSIRAIDDLGRIRIPKRMRSQMNIHPGDLIQICCDGDLIHLYHMGENGGDKY